MVWGWIVAAIFITPIAMALVRRIKVSPTNEQG